MSSKPLHKICHLLLGAADEVAGIQKYICSIADKNTLIIINRSKNYEKYLKSIKVNFYVYKNSFDLIELLRRKQINILHCHLGAAALVGFWSSFFCSDLRLVYTQHFIDPQYTKSKIAFIKNMIFRIIFLRFRAVLAISQAVLAGILKRREVPEQKIQLVYNGLSFAKTIHKKTVSKKILTICRLQPEKNPELILELAHLLPDYEFVVLGSGDLLEKLRAEAYPNCNFLGYTGNIRKYLSEAGFFFFPAPAEPFGYAVLEALAHNLPVIGLAGGALPELITPHCGLLLSRPDVYQARDYIINLTKNKQAYKKTAAAAYARAGEFSLTKMQSGLHAVYAKISK